MKVFPNSRAFWKACGVNDFEAQFFRATRYTASMQYARTLHRVVLSKTQVLDGANPTERHRALGAMPQCFTVHPLAPKEVGFKGLFCKINGDIVLDYCILQ